MKTSNKSLNWGDLLQVVAEFLWSTSSSIIKSAKWYHPVKNSQISIFSTIGLRLPKSVCLIDIVISNMWILVGNSIFVYFKISNTDFQSNRVLIATIHSYWRHYFKFLKFDHKFDFTSRYWFQIKPSNK